MQSSNWHLSKFQPVQATTISKVRHLKVKEKLLPPQGRISQVAPKYGTSLFSSTTIIWDDTESCRLHD
jgi:hypothetical protein